MLTLQDKIVLTGIIFLVVAFISGMFEAAELAWWTLFISVVAFLVAVWM